MDSFFRLRRSSHTPAYSQGGQEPLIVVEESENNEKEEEASNQSSQRQSLDIESPENPYLLSPWRETRKHSLPTPPCTSGITASQVRRLSERGGEGSGPSPREQAFLATLYSTPAPQPGGRRHSVVTISRVPPTMFGRNRRESIAALPAGQRSNASSRRESNIGPPPSTDHRASSATEINRCGEKEHPSPLASHAFPLRSAARSPTAGPSGAAGAAGAADPPKSNLQKNRSNSFDISLYQNIKQLATGGGSGGGSAGPPDGLVESGWFVKRHQPMARRKSASRSPSATVTFARETFDKLREAGTGPAHKEEPKPKPKESRSPLNKLKWDGRSAIVDARMIGHAIENFITGSSSSSPSASSSSGGKKSSAGGKEGGTGRSTAGAKKSVTSSWFGKADEDEDSNDTCDSSLCSTLKDLFVK
ncbi:uncharacterized protein LOC121590072 isoform X2 [Anopheles merus]|uniref:uncharacterized protein LOC121590072 isoform X2 n=1 Tax=Anopheles merus TaxID=30066 RepID=UPI001BE47776|nr:uncharacterized protein LOC121590072 isoform X2 [Anopheles merus]